MKSLFLFLLSFAVLSQNLVSAPLPAKYLDWVPTNDPSYIVEPTTGLKTTGFTTAKPTFQNMNWNFNLADQWIKYLKDQSDIKAALASPVFTGSIGVPDGSVSVPALAFTSDADGSGTGIYRVGANSLGFASNGVNVGQYTSIGAWTKGAAAGLGTGAAAYNKVYGSTLHGLTSNLSSGSISANNSFEISPGFYRDGSGAIKANATQTGYTQVRSDRATASGSNVFIIAANYQDAQTADSAIVSTNTRDILIGTAAGSWIAGPTASVATNLTVNGKSLVTGAASGAQISSIVQNTSNTAGAVAAIKMFAGGTTSDSAISSYYSGSGANSWNTGVKSSDNSYNFAFNATENLASGISGTISSAGAVNFPSIHNNANGNIRSGRYSPTLTSVANVAGTTTRSCMFLQVGSTVFVSGEIDASNTLATNTKSVIGMSLPVPSNFTSGFDAGGAGTKLYATGNTSVAVGVYADAASDTVYLEYPALLTNNTSIFFSFSYEVK